MAERKVRAIRGQLWRWIRSILFASAAAVCVAVLPIWTDMSLAAGMTLAPIFFVLIVAIDETEYERLAGTRRKRRRQAVQTYDLRKEMEKAAS